MAAASRTVLRSTSIESALGAPDGSFIDLRSPAEFEQDHVPGAHSVPLFDDEERALIGTLYARRSKDLAFEAALKKTRGRIGSLTREVGSIVGWSPPAGELVGIVEDLTQGGLHELEERLAELEKGDEARPVFLYCWRGQLRSRSVTAFLSLLGLTRATLVEGGYKAYRGHVIKTLADWTAPPAFVLRGWTGAGKTLVLRELERIRPGWTLDLELAAGHRSSILGMVGLEPTSQRGFESALFDRMRAGFPAGLVVLEGESRKVGDVIQPQRVWEALDGGVNLRLATSMSQRIQVLAEDYLAHPESRSQLAERLPFLEQRLGRVKYKGVLTGLLAADRISELVELLLEKYYDPLYAHSEKSRNYAAEFDSTDPIRCAEEIAAYVEARVNG